MTGSLVILCFLLACWPNGGQLLASPMGPIEPDKEHTDRESSLTHCINNDSLGVFFSLSSLALMFFPQASCCSIQGGSCKCKCKRKVQTHQMTRPLKIKPWCGGQLHLPCAWPCACHICARAWT